MTLEPLVSIILLLFFIFLLAALIIWLSLELRAMGLRDRDRSRTLQAVAKRAASSESYDPVTTITQEQLDSELNTGLETAPVAKKVSKTQKRPKTRNTQKQSAVTGQGIAKPQQGMSSKSSAFKTTSFGSSTANVDAFAQFAEEGSEALDFGAENKSVDVGHEATLLKPPKPENDIFSTSERRDDIWLFHTAEVDPVHPAEDMTKFRQPGGVTGQGGRGGRGGRGGKGGRDSHQDNSSEASIEPPTNVTTEITAPIQPENKLRDIFGNTNNEEEKVVRMTNSSSRIAAERLLVDKEIRKTQAEAHQATNAAAIANDSPVEMPVSKTITPAKPSKPFQGAVPPIPKGVQQNLKQTLDEVTDNVSNTSKDDWKNYKNLKNTRSLISTNSDDD